MTRVSIALTPDAHRLIWTSLPQLPAQRAIRPAADVPALLELLGCHPVRIWRIAGTHVPFLLVVRILRTNPPGRKSPRRMDAPPALG